MNRAVARFTSSAATEYGSPRQYFARAEMACRAPTTAKAKKPAPKKKTGGPDKRKNNGDGNIEFNCDGEEPARRLPTGRQAGATFLWGRRIGVGGLVCLCGGGGEFRGGGKGGGGG